MHTAPTDENDWTPDALKRRIGNYICRIISFNSGWGIHGRGKRPDGFYGHFFRFDANRMTRMVLACEHLIRCMIIWMALRAYRDDGVQPANFRLPSSGARGPRAPEPPMDPIFKLRALPLREPRLPPFLISLPQPTKDAALSAFYANGSSPEQNENAAGARATALSETHRENNLNGSGSAFFTSDRAGAARPSLRGTRASKRKRNDQILDCNLLVERSHRLSKLLEEIDPRARRLAARWAGYLTKHTPELSDEPYKSAALSPFYANESSREQSANDAGAAALSATHREPRSPDPGEAGGQTEMSLRTTSPSNLEYSPEHDPSRKRRTPRSGRSNQTRLNPLKTYWPPPELLTGAAEDEAEDLNELHDVALRATEAFIGLCG